MSVSDPQALSSAPAAPRTSPFGLDPWALGLVLVAFAALFVPSFMVLAQTIWRSDENGHGPIILAVAFWLLYQLREPIAAIPRRPAPWSGGLLLLFGTLLYIVGHSQAIIIFEIGAQIPILAALLLIFHGWGALRRAWFPLFFLLFMLPLPEALVATVTAPLKSAVSAVASHILYAWGYPVGRAGVILTVGPYQLLVADACAGLNSMFTLEALGLLYMNLMNYRSAGRNITLALLLIPIAFVANVCRVLILVLVTYYWGDAAGQGFVHGFAGMVLFMVALVVMLIVDRVLDLFFPNSRQRLAKGAA